MHHAAAWLWVLQLWEGKCLCLCERAGKGGKALVCCGPLVPRAAAVEAAACTC